MSSDHIFGEIHFTAFSDHKQLDGLHNKKLDKVASNRTMRAMEEIFSHNISVGHIKACRNSVADCLSRLPTNTKEMPHWEKFFKPINKTTKGQKQISTLAKEGDVLSIQRQSGSVIIQGPEEEVTPPSLFIIYEGTVMDLQLNEMAENASTDEDYQGIINLKREGKDMSDILNDNPLKKYNREFNKLSIVEMPAGGLLVYEENRIYIPEE